MQFLIRTTAFDIALELPVVVIIIEIPFFCFRGIEIVAKRFLQPLYYVDLIWNLSEGARRMREFNQFGRKIFREVKKT